MTKDSKEKLLIAYRAASAAKLTSIADLLEDVILDVMGDSGVKVEAINANVSPYRVESLDVPRAVPTSREGK